MSHEFDIAIVGMSGRFPGAGTVDEFWRNLADGIESITKLTDAEILESGVPASCLSHPTYVKASPVLENPDHFDAGFFGFPPMEARTLDPQHRLLLELAYEALESAGYDPERYQGRIGVFAGSAMNTYFSHTGLNSRLAEQYIPTLIGNDKDFLSTRVSYKLNLKGPSITVQTACSTSMVAVHLARQSLLSGETDMALAGAVSVRVPHRAGYFYDSGGVVSPDGRVRAFDAGANGTVFGSGGGILVLKRRADAVADGDTIHAVIKGSSVNNDGSEKAGYTAPSVNSQADAVVEALANAEVDADSISYIEAHGSGTPVGDPIEIRALTKAFRTFTPRSGYCAIGSVKTNVGHLDVAAGVTGIIKTVLALEHRQLPPSLHFMQANPEIDFPNTPFYVNTRLSDWASDGPRRAGVMSTGMGGTNAHVVLEEAPEPTIPTDTGTSHLLVLSAKTETALEQTTDRLREFLASHDAVNMNDLAYTLQIGRKAFPYRRCLVCGDREDAVTTLSQRNVKRVLSSRPDDSQRPVIFLLPGVGDQYVDMAHGLYETWDVFKEAVDQCASILTPHLGIDIRHIIYPPNRAAKNTGQKGIDLKMMLGRSADGSQDEDAKRLNTTLFGQPALFTIEYAMTRLWQSLGITPTAIVGHSMGEYVAACIAGVMSLQDALTLIATRARLVDELPPGAMLAVTLSERELLPLLPEELSISLVNGPSLCVVAGPVLAVGAFETMLHSKGIICRPVQNTHPFHSRMLDPIANAFETAVKNVRLNKPTLPCISNVTGTWITDLEATSPSYWARHATHTARFNDAFRALWRYKNPMLLEAGPGRTLTVLAMQHPGRQEAGNSDAICSIRSVYENQSDEETLLHAVGRLWLSGAAINWQNLHSGRPRRRVPLPTYPFERQRHWMEVQPSGSQERQEAEKHCEMLPLDNWFYVPSWKRALSPSGLTRRCSTDTSWLIFSDRHGGGIQITAHLCRLGFPARHVRFGNRFERRSADLFELNPAAADDYVKLFQALKVEAPGAINIIHLGCVTQGDSSNTPSDSSQDYGFYSLLHIAQAVGELSLSTPVTIAVLSNRMHEVFGEEGLVPDMAPVLGPCGVIPKEFPNITCFNIDLPDSRPIDSISDEVLSSIVAEFTEPRHPPVVAYRGRYRWERHFEAVRVPSRIPACAAPGSDLGPLRRGGVYLITGGTGGIGLAIAKYLAVVCRPRIVLTKKTSFPPKAAWRQLAEQGGASARVLRTIRSLLEIEDQGAEVDVRVADSSDRSRMQAVVAETLQTHGALNGVIHAAGLVGTGLIQTKSRDIAESVLAPKVDGTRILFDLVKHVDLDFLALFSSMTSILGPYAQADYSGANAFLDAFTYAANRQAPFRTLTINWPGWKEVGIIADLETPAGAEGWKEAALKKAITTRDGLEVFSRALRSELRHVFVCPNHLPRELEEALAPFDTTAYVSQLRSPPNAAPYSNQQLDRSDQPTDEVEATVARLWSEVLGVERIGVHENFANLGGHSLLAMQIVTKVRSIYQISLSLRDFLEAPSIAQLSAVIQAKVLADVEALTDEQAHGLMSNASPV